jgi:hypothetical protein
MASSPSFVLLDGSMVALILREIAGYYAQHWGTSVNSTRILTKRLVADAKPAARRTLARFFIEEELRVAAETFQGLENLIRSAGQLILQTEGSSRAEESKQRWMKSLLAARIDQKTLKIDDHGGRRLVANDAGDEMYSGAIDVELERLGLLTDAAGRPIARVVERCRAEFQAAFARLDAVRDRVGPRRFQLAEFNVVAPLLHSYRTGFVEVDIDELPRPQREKVLKAGITQQLALLRRVPDGTRAVRAGPLRFERFVRAVEAWADDPAEVAKRAKKRDAKKKVGTPDDIRLAKSGKPGNNDWYIVTDSDGNVVRERERRRRARGDNDPTRRRGDSKTQATASSKRRNDPRACGP